MTNTHTRSRSRIIQSTRRLAAQVSGIFAFLFVLLTALVWPGITKGFDLSITQAVVAHRNGFLNVLAPVLSTLGGTKVVLVFSLICLGLLAWRKHWLQVEILFGTLAGDVIIVTAFKRTISRMRPDSKFWLGSVEDQQSFPSGHSANNTVLWLMLAIVVSTLARTQIQRAWARALNVLAIVMPILIGLSRIYVAHHWTTDVLGGWCLGIAWVGFATWIYFGQLEKLHIQSAQHRERK
ncbi:phosphatase PAP2 family protein [Alloscardovia omnicolens]|uniref:phosphatase PAP2 family protein n=1 Tax=Alloscardovia omnicolens TaxID=419015 RepID=UPI003A659B7B